MPDTNWLREQELKHRVGIATFTPPANWHVGLSSTLPTAGGTNVTEPSGNGYARASVASGAAGWTYTTDQIANAAVVTLGPSTGAWLASASMPYALIWTAATGGNLAAFATLIEARTVTGTGQTVSIAIGGIVWKRVTLP